MKKINKILTFMLVSIMLLSMTGCGVAGPKVTEKVDEERTQLYVGTYDGGVGSKWLTDAIERFEKKYEDTSFEEGKTGVQVILAEKNNTTMHGATLLETIDTTKTEVFFTESVFYYDWVAQGGFYDLTDAVNEPLTEFGEEESIADKMYKEVKDSLVMDGKIYAIPFWTGSYNMVYNATLFDYNKWYFSETGSFTDAKGKLSAGPDGKTGTYDDGMPATYDQFFLLLDEIAKDNVTPFQWAGGADYFPWFIGSLIADYEGYDKFMLNYTFDGTATLVKPGTVNVNTGAFQTEEVQITAQNGYELARQGGVLNALKFAQRLVRGAGVYYDTNVVSSGSFKQQDAQLAFIRNATTTSNKPVAILLDGSWWENESVVAFEETYGAGGTKHDSEFEYKYMPLPKADESKIGSENVIVSPLESYCFINPNIQESKEELAVKFIQFCHTDESMKIFTEETGMMKPYHYEKDEDKLTSYAKSVIEAEKNSKVVAPKSNNALYRGSSASFWTSSLLTMYGGAGSSTNNVFLTLNAKAGDKYTTTYSDCFERVIQYRKEVLWENLSDLVDSMK